MSFSSQTKEELARVWPPHACCQRGELAGLVRGGSLQLHGRGEAALVLATEHLFVARKALHLGKSLGMQQPALTQRQNPRGEGRVYELHLPVTARMLVELGIIDEEGRIANTLPEHLTERGCARRAFLRGLFLATGSVNHPLRGHHLEMRLQNESLADAVSQLLFAAGIAARLAARRQSLLVYLKDADSIADFLNLVGAHQTLLEYENTRVLKEVKGRTNRLVNADQANLQKSVNASFRQLQDLRLIQETVGLASLGPGLREITRLRMMHPEASLAELGELCHPPLGKSGVNHRLRKLAALAARLRSAQEKKGDFPNK